MTDAGPDAPTYADSLRVQLKKIVTDSQALVLMVDGPERAAKSKALELNLERFVGGVLVDRAEQAIGPGRPPRERA